jgi:hypothetical protein
MTGKPLPRSDPVGEFDPEREALLPPHLRAEGLIRF